MSYVITEPCIGNKDSSCVQVCPVDCIDSIDEEEQFFIDPTACIDCGYCLTVCPVNAIFHEFTVPPQWRNYIPKNKEFFNKDKTS